MTSLRSLPALVRRRPVISGLLVLITILGAFWRFDAIGTSTRVSVDERSYVGLANGLNMYRSYVYGENPRHWGPGTPFMFAGAMKLTGVKFLSNRPGGKNVALYAQATVGTLTILAVFAFAAWLGGPIAGLFAAAFTAAYDPLILVARSYLAEPLGGFGLVLAVGAIAVAVARPARRKRVALIAGALLGFAILARNDMLPLFGVLPLLALIFAWRREQSFKAGFRLAALLVVGAVVTVSPWVFYVSKAEKKFTPITTAGPSSLWVATYLPAGGRQIILKRQFAAEVCRTFPDRTDACGVSATDMDMRLVFELLQRRHPGMTEDEAVQAELDRNIRDYAFGQPIKFGEMLANKSTRIWGKPWGGGALGRQESSVWQHRILLGIALIGLFVGSIFGGRRRRYVLLAAAALFTVTALNTIFVSESRMSLRMTPLLFAAGVGGIGAAVRARRGDDEPEIKAATVAGGSGPDREGEEDGQPATDGGPADAATTDEAATGTGPTSPANQRIPPSAGKTSASGATGPSHEGPKASPSS